MVSTLEVDSSLLLDDHSSVLSRLEVIELVSYLRSSIVVLLSKSDGASTAVACWLASLIIARIEFSIIVEQRSQVRFGFSFWLLGDIELRVLLSWVDKRSSILDIDELSDLVEHLG